MQAAGMSVPVELTAAEVAQLMGRDMRSVQRFVANGALPGEKRLNERNRPTWYIPLTALPAKLQARWRKGRAPARAAITFPTVPRAMESFSLAEQEEIRFWSVLLEDWLSSRFERRATPKAEADADFIAYAKVQYQQKHQEIYGRELSMSIQSLYRRWKAYKENDLAGLLDKRGQARKGSSCMPGKVWDAFLYYYLDAAQHPVAKCVEYTREWVLETCPELYEDIPSDHSFYRRVKREIPVPVAVLAREGEKAFRDRCAPYITREYDTMESNEYWVADTHTLDVISNDEDGRQHRLCIVAFFDARSGIFTGCYVADQPSSQATLMALRRAILRHGIPLHIYVDNGREFLTRDVGGLGHRARKKHRDEFVPPPVFERLGITMVNALPRNARAKIIERRFRDVKDHLSRLFPTFTGGNITERPEQLKYNLKAGKIVADQELCTMVEQMLYNYFNIQPYGGAVVRDRGKPRQQVYVENLHTKRVPKTEEDLNLLMLRTSRVQTVGRKGVHLLIGSKRLDYYNDELLTTTMFGREVYCRYDPDNLAAVRVYDTSDRLLTVAPLDEVLRAKYGADTEKVKSAMREKARLERAVATLLESTGLDKSEGISAIRLVVEQAKRQAELAAQYHDSANVIELVQDAETPWLKAVGLDDEYLDTMLQNAEIYNAGLYAQGGEHDEQGL